MDNGNKGKIEPAGVAEGTSIEVSHIFANQPQDLLSNAGQPLKQVRLSML